MIDTGVLLRLVIRTNPAHQETRNAVCLLKARGDNLVALMQNAAEFWNVCTRPASVGGCGLSILETQGKLRVLERLGRKNLILLPRQTKGAAAGCVFVRRADDLRHPSRRFTDHKMILSSVNFRPSISTPSEITPRKAVLYEQ